MPDDPSKKDYHDRNRVAGEQEHEVRYFAEKHGIGMDQARELIDRCGNDRAMLEREVQKLKGTA